MPSNTFEEHGMFLTPCPQICTLTKSVAMNCKHRDDHLHINIPVLHQGHVQTEGARWNASPSRRGPPPRPSWYTPNPDTARQTQRGYEHSSAKIHNQSFCRWMNMEPRMNRNLNCFYLCKNSKDENRFVFSFWGRVSASEAGGFITTAEQCYFLKR